MPEKEYKHLVTHDQMLGSIVVVGRIVGIVAQDATPSDPVKPLDVPRVLVHVGSEVSDSFIRGWMPWVATRAGYDGEWWAPEKGEQVVVVSPSGDLAQGIIVGSIFRGSGINFDTSLETITQVPDDIQRHIHKRLYQDGTSISYDRQSHKWEMALKATPDDVNPAAVINASLVDNKAKVSVVLGNASQPSVNIVADANAASVTIVAENVTIESTNTKVKGELVIDGDVKVKGKLDVE